jgi:hypothetical protein
MYRKLISTVALTLHFLSLIIAVSRVNKSPMGLQSDPVHNLNSGLDYSTI